MRPEYYISRATLEKLIKHYERRSRAKRGWSTYKMTEIVRDTLQALREVYETEYCSSHTVDCAIWPGGACNCEPGKGAL